MSLTCQYGTIYGRDIGIKVTGESIIVQTIFTGG